MAAHREAPPRFPRRRNSAFDQDNEVAPRRPPRREALPREATLAVQRVVDRDCLVSTSTTTTA
jgi:hypothetical protein